MAVSIAPNTLTALAPSTLIPNKLNINFPLHHNSTINQFTLDDGCICAAITNHGFPPP
ncbi:hypothetical protein HOLleu_29995 [Holothuria leucospilota]|uniref:Uncharacterized protein n=1 Tax=Holothuria leucospilota TaxID=206669 RepID=A0A9Q1BK13_HOLLE|nr:hypothetical protein HOLleu_29995 [Holothuria leucospilota]